MSRQVRNVSILGADGELHKWRFVQFGADDGLELGLDLMDLIGESIGQVVGSLDFSGGVSLTKMSIDGDMLGRSISGLAKRVVKRGGVTFVKRLLKGARRDGRDLVMSNDEVPTDPKEGQKVVSFNRLFMGNYGEMVRAVAHVVDHNFRSFFDGWFVSLRNNLNNPNSRSVLEKLSAAVTSATGPGSGESSPQGTETRVA